MRLRLRLRLRIRIIGLGFEYALSREEDGAAQLARYREDVLGAGLLLVVALVLLPLRARAAGGRVGEHLTLDAARPHRVEQVGEEEA